MACSHGLDSYGSCTGTSTLPGGTVRVDHLQHRRAVEHEAVVARCCPHLLDGETGDVVGIRDRCLVLPCNNHYLGQNYIGHTNIGLHL